ncbi:MAG: hypothetical protein SH856_02740 [Flavobacteriales bacterium]|nr:hypothetical protein [Flavobacteriales bacterium]
MVGATDSSEGGFPALIAQSACGSANRERNIFKGNFYDVNERMMWRCLLAGQADADIKIIIS